ncbi:EamA family transporter [Alcaligenaceae bacterium C4P045]|nr:EamA family transporter [Alcaligenaceae bacterium C4P045]
MNASHPFTARDYLCALVVVLVWGMNFVVMKIGLQTLSPMMLGALRFALASLPFMLFVKRPSVPWRLVVVYGLAQGVGQFGFLFTAIHLGMPAGMASLVIQTQAFFTLMLAAGLLREPARAHHWLGLIVAATGLAVIASASGQGPAAMTMIGFVLTLCAAFMWATSNLIVRIASRAAPGYDPVSFIIWSSAAPIVPFVLAAIAMDGADVAWSSVVNIGWPAFLSALYLALLATILAYSLWTRLLMRHAAGRVAPFSLLVPVVGLTAAAWAFDEHLLTIQWVGAAIVLLGLLVNQLGGRFRRRN